MKKKYSLFAKAIFSFALMAMIAANISAQTVQTFNSSATWTCPAGVSQVTVECWGGGGGGGSSANATADGGCGGGGGGYSQSVLSVAPSTTYTVTVGAGGTGAPASATTTATAGSESWFNTSSTILAKGGALGVNNSTTGGGAGGPATSGIGTVRWSGGMGANATASDGGGGGSSAGTGTDGNYVSATVAVAGAAAPAGGGNGGNSLTTGNAQDGFAPGGGGGGSDDVAAYAGGAGAAGQVVLTYSTITSFTPTFACVGTTPTITITGTGFSGVTSVTFNTLNAAFTVVSATQITATVPSSATTGPIQITTSYGVCFSVGFLIVPLTPLTVTISAVAPSPNTGMGPFTVCCNGTIYYFQATITNGGSAPTIQWYDAATPIGTNSATLSYSATCTSMIYCVVTYGGTGVLCPDNVPATSNTIAFNPVAAPSQPGIVNGLDTVCVNQTGVIYTTTAANASTYTWTVPGSATFTGQGNDSIIVNWGSTPGTYVMTVTAYNICGVSSPVRTKTITVLPLVPPPALTIVDAAGGPTTICVNDCINFSAIISESVLNKVALWKVNGVPLFTSAPSISPVFFTYPNPGSFSYCFPTGGAHMVTCEITFNGQPAPGQCYSPNVSVSNTVFYTVSICTGIHEITDNASLKIYPNPADGKINLRWENPSGAGCEIILTDGLGKTISVFRTDKNHLGIESASLKSGIYFITVRAGEKIFRSQVVNY